MKEKLYTFQTVVATVVILACGIAFVMFNLAARKTEILKQEILLRPNEFGSDKE